MPLEKTHEAWSRYVSNEVFYKCFNAGAIVSVFTFLPLKFIICTFHRTGASWANGDLHTALFESVRFLVGKHVALAQVLKWRLMYCNVSGGGVQKNVE